MASDSLRAKAAALPTTPGVYLFKDARGKVLYVGKAINLRARVRQYLAGADERFMVPFMVSRAADIEVVVVGSEKEALLLENTLIKEHRPKYNVKLRDDSNFLRLRLDPTVRWPTYRLVREFGRDRARYFGPYHSASRARQTLAALQRSFPLRTCSDATLRSRRRPCLLYQMGRCVAPCVDADDPAAFAAEYAEIVQESMWFLEGRRGPLVARLRERMAAAAEAERFEEAARLRDLVADIDATLARQEVVDSGLADRDIWGLHREGARAVVTLVPVRVGQMGEPVATVLSGAAGEDPDLLSSLVNRTYSPPREIPPEVLLPVLPADADALSEVLSERRGRKVKVRCPQRGDKVRLLEIARANAEVRFHREHDEGARRQDALVRLGELLELPGPPRRVECFDNSNIGGEQPVAAMAVLIDGVPDRAEYRRYRIKTVVGADDYASMREILARRVRRALDGSGPPLPDLLVVDGGKGQLSAAVAALHDLGVHAQPIVGISKPRTERRRGDRAATDKLVLPHRKDPLKLRDHDPALRLVQYVRDEVHNHAIRYHRKVRRRETLLSVLEAIPGVGPARRQVLLKTLGSARAVAEADVQTLAKVPGIGPATAAQIFAALRGPPSPGGSPGG